MREISLKISWGSALYHIFCGDYCRDSIEKQVTQVVVCDVYVHPWHPLQQTTGNSSMSKYSLE